MSVTSIESYLGSATLSAARGAAVHAKTPNDPPDGPGGLARSARDAVRDMFVRRHDAVVDEGFVRGCAHGILQIERVDGQAKFYLLPEDADIRGVGEDLIGAHVVLHADQDYRVTRVRPHRNMRNLRSL